MKIIDAFWEKRNLGVNSKEITINENDSVEELKELQNEIQDTGYYVVKVPTGRFDILAELHELGFIFVEASISVEHDLKNIELKGPLSRINNEIGYKKMNDNDIEELYSEMKNNLFETDRIFLDNNFNKEQASNRYINWIKDEISRNTELYNIVYKGKNIGFFTFKELQDKIYYPFLASLYNDYKRTGLGFSIVQKPLEEAKRRNGKMISTYVSSNNLPIFKIHSLLGFQTNSISYVLVKHVI